MHGFFLHGVTMADLEALGVIPHLDVGGVYFEFAPMAGGRPVAALFSGPYTPGLEDLLEVALRERGMAATVSLESDVR